MLKRPTTKSAVFCLETRNSPGRRRAPFRIADKLCELSLALGIQGKGLDATRGHLPNYGWVAPTGTYHLTMLADLLENGEIDDPCLRRHGRCLRC